MTSAKRKSLEPSVFQVKEDGNDTLLGSRCKKCDRTFFPSRTWCAACLEPACETIELSREGTLASFAFVDRKQTYCIVEPPYVFGEVLLPEGLRVYTTINLYSEVSPEGMRVRSALGLADLDKLEIGRKVILKPIVIKKDEQGSDVVAYNFDLVEAAK